MKVHKWVQFEKEIELDIGKDDIEKAMRLIQSEVDSVALVLNGLNSFAGFLKAIPEPVFTQLNAAQRHTISEFFRDQMHRFKP